MRPSPIVIENIDDFLKGSAYYVKNFEIHEALSEPTKCILELVITSGNLWNINIPLHHGIKITVNYWTEQQDEILTKLQGQEWNQLQNIQKQEEKEEHQLDEEYFHNLQHPPSTIDHQWQQVENTEQKIAAYKKKHQNQVTQYDLQWSRTVHGFTTFVKKTFGDHGDKGIWLPTLIIEFHHRLFELSYDTKYRIHKYRTHSEIIEENCKFKDIVVFNECLLMHIERVKMFNQFGENDLHLFERLVQYYGAFFYCHDNGFEVTIHNSVLAYTLMFPSVSTYFFDRYSTNMTNKIFSIEMEEIQVPRDYHTIDYEIKRPEHLIGYAYHLDGYGVYQNYPANRFNLIGTEQQALHIKKRFVKKKYKGSSGCYDMKAGKRIIIDSWAQNHHHVIINVSHKFAFNSIDNSILYTNDFLLHEIGDDSYVTNKDLPQPLVPGIQTATVKATSPVMEIDTNREGEVFVEFHWLKHIPDLTFNILLGTLIDIIDRLEFYSCWIPVAQVMAGQGCGSYIIPRKGDEVLVYFINGNPDRPIIFGAIHNHKNREFITDMYDHFKTVLMRSRTFYQLDILNAISNYSFNEISMCDIPFDQKLYLKACKDLIIHIGHENPNPSEITKDEDPMLQNNFDTRIFGKGHQRHYIQNGGYHLDLDNGVAEQNVHGSYMINVFPGDKGMDMTIVIAGGQLLITANAGSEQNYEADLLINVTGNCTINTEGITNINSVGPLNLSSEASITLTAPTITMEAETLITMNSGEDITIDAGGVMDTNVGGDVSLKVGGAIEETVGADISTKIGGAMEINVGTEIEISSGAALEITAGADISMESGAAVEVTAGANVSVSGGAAVEITGGADVSITAGGAVETTAGADIGITAGAGVEITAGAEVNIFAPAILSLESGLEMNISSGVSMTFEAGIDMNLAAGISFSAEGGIDANIAGGICATLDAGITADVTSGIASSIDSGIETALTAGVNMSSDSGILFEINAAILGTVSTAIEVFVKRPRLF